MAAYDNLDIEAYVCKNTPIYNPKKHMCMYLYIRISITYTVYDIYIYNIICIHLKSKDIPHKMF